MNQLAKEITDAIRETVDEMGIDKDTFFTKLLKKFNKHQEKEPDKFLEA